MIYQGGMYYETKSQENITLHRISAVSRHMLVFFAIPDHSGCFRAYHERQFHCVHGNVRAVHVLRTGLVRIPLPGRRPAGVCVSHQRQAHKTGKTQPDQICDLDPMDDRIHCYVYSRKKPCDD